MTPVNLLQPFYMKPHFKQLAINASLLFIILFTACKKNEKKYNTEKERIDIIYDFCRHMESFTKKNEDKECTSTQEINYNIEDIQKHFNDIFIFSQSENKKDITNKETSEETSQKQQ